jgi:hypothetical protein
LVPPTRAPHHAPRHHICAHVDVVPPLIDNAKYIDSGPCFLFPQQVHPLSLDVLPSPLSSCLQKQEIVQNDPANCSSSCCQRWRCCHPKARSVCQLDGSLILAYCQTIPPPPPKGECLQCASVTLLRPVGRKRGDTEGGRGRNGDEVHGADAVFVVGFGRKY